MIEKIILIEPKFESMGNFPIKIPKIGLINLGCLLKEKGYEVKIYSELISELDHKDISTADLVGITSFTCNVNRAYKLADKIRKIGIPVVLGGPHATFMPEEALKHCDYVIRGEGDKSFIELVEGLNKNEPLTNISGLSYLENGNIANNQYHILDNLDELPPLDLSIVDGYDKHKKRFIDFHSIRLDPISTSRGCPFNCKFCSVIKMFGRKCRFRSIDSVIKDIKNVTGYVKKKTIIFVDDNFAINKERTKELLRRIIKEKIKIRYMAQARVDVANDDELMALLRKSGCLALLIGFESVNNKTLEELNKKQNLEDIKKAVDKLHENKIQIVGLFLVGADNDDLNTINDTVKFAISNKIEFIMLSALTPLPGTEIFKELKEANRIISYDWNNYDISHVVISPKNMLASKLQERLIEGYREFYSLKSTLQILLRGKPVLAWYRLILHFRVRKLKVEFVDHINLLKKIEKIMVIPQVNTS